MNRTFVFVLLAAAWPAQAGDVYVWTDQDGRRQISDVVPPRYLAKARRVQVPDTPAPPPAEDLRSAAAGGSAGSTAAMDCDAQWKEYEQSRECIAFNEQALRGFDADPREGCEVAPVPLRTCPPPPMGISSR